MQRARLQFALVLAGLALLALGCSGTRARVRPTASSAWSAALEYGSGSLVGGQHAPGASRTEPASAPASVNLRCSAWWLAEAPREPAAPLVAHARLVLAPLAAEPFRVSSSLAPGARYADAGASSRWLEREARPASASAHELGSFDLVLLAGQVARIELHEAEQSFSGAALELALDAQGQPQAVLELASARPGTSPQRERLLLEQLFAPGEALSAVFAPIAGPDARGWGCAFALERGIALDESQARAAERVARTAAQAAPAAEPEDPDARAAQALRATALVGLASASERRQALLALAELARAPFARELARSADQELLASWAERVRASDDEDSGPADFAWALERHAWQCVLERSASRNAANAGGSASATPNEERERAPEPGMEARANRDGGRGSWRAERDARSASPAAQAAEQAAALERAAALGLLLRHAGEAARVEGLLAELLDSCSSSAELQARLLEENRYALEDSAPAARVRAYDWLAARGLQPQGYDPLAGREARRAALLALERAAAGLASDEAQLEAPAQPGSTSAPTSVPASAPSMEREP